MRSLTSNFETEKNKKTGAAPVWILKIPFAAGTVYLSDRVFTISGWISPDPTILPWIASWGEIDENISGQLTLPIVSDLSVQIIIDPDAEDDIYDLLCGEPVEKLACELYHWYEGLDASTDPPILVWAGNICDFEKISEIIYDVDLVDESVGIDNYPGRVLSLADYPLASLNDVGRQLPIIYGSVNGVPAIGLDVGARTTLISELTGTTGLGIGTTVTKVAHGDFFYGATSYKAADPVGVTPGNDVIPVNKYGAVGFFIGTNGVVDAVEAIANATGYNTPEEAIADVPHPGDHLCMGYVTAKSTSGSFTFGTTALNAANTVVAYTSLSVHQSFYITDARGIEQYDIIIVEDEEIYINNITGNYISSSVRGHNGTAAVAHLAGALVQQKKMGCVFMFADHPVHSIGNIYAIGSNGLDVDITARCTKYTGQTGSELEGYEGKAVITVPAVQSIEVYTCLDLPKTLTQAVVSAVGTFATPQVKTVIEKYYLIYFTCSCPTPPVAHSITWSAIGGLIMFAQGNDPDPENVYTPPAMPPTMGATTDKKIKVNYHWSITTPPSAGVTVTIRLYDPTGVSGFDVTWTINSAGVTTCTGGASGFEIAWTGTVAPSLAVTKSYNAGQEGNWYLWVDDIGWHQVGSGAATFKINVKSDDSLVSIGTIDESGWTPLIESPYKVTETGAWHTGEIAISHSGGSLIGGVSSLKIDKVEMCQVKEVAPELSEAGTPAKISGEGYQDDAAGSFSDAASAESHYPLVHSDTYVKATTKYSTALWPYFATDPSLSVLGSNGAGAWVAQSGVVTNQRFHIDLGAAIIITRIYYENHHHLGGITNAGVQNFTLWGSNEISAFLNLTYGTDANWMQLTTSQSTFDQHVAADQADPKYITVTNTTPYRYYAFKFADNYGNATYMGVRRIELQNYMGLIERPDHVFRHFLYTYASWLVANFITDAATPFAADSYAFGMVINTRKRMKEWLAYMALQCRSYFRFAAGKAHLLYRPDTLVSDKTVAKFSDNEDHTTTMRVRRSPQDEVINKIDLHYKRDWSKPSGAEAYQAVEKAEDQDSIDDYGEKEKPEIFLFDFITSEAMAADLAAFYIARYKDRKKIVTGDLCLDHVELEFADGVTLTEAGGILCEIQKAGVAPGSADMIDRIIIKAREY